ncbi:MAG TPA: ABC transporter [Firmicutes bacterium]|nr:ABC transporter [Bacillota bacterium]
MVLEVKDLSYKYKDGDSYVLKNLNFSFEEGLVYVIKGKSGCGKTTFLSLISGLEKYEEGSIKFLGEELKTINLDYYRSRDIGIVFQSFNLLPGLSAIENIILAMNVSGVKDKDKKSLAIELLESVGLNEEKGDRRVLKLSGGEEQRVAIARSIAYDAKVIIADEPTGNLDKETETEIMAIFKDLAKLGKCVIIVTHSNNVAKMADVVYELKPVKQG